MAYSEASYAQPVTAQTVPEVSAAMHELAEAVHRSAVTAEILVHARVEHEEATAREAALRDTVAKLREQANV